MEPSDRKLSTSTQKDPFSSQTKTEEDHKDSSINKRLEDMLKANNETNLENQIKDIKDIIDSNDYESMPQSDTFKTEALLGLIDMESPFDTNLGGNSFKGHDLSGKDTVSIKNQNFEGSKDDLGKMPVMENQRQMKSENELGGRNWYDYEEKSSEGETFSIDKKDIEAKTEHDENLQQVFESGSRKQIEPEQDPRVLLEKVSNKVIPKIQIEDIENSKQDSKMESMSSGENNTKGNDYDKDESDRDQFGFISNTVYDDNVSPIPSPLLRGHQVHKDKEKLEELKEVDKEKEKKDIKSLDDEEYMQEERKSSRDIIKLIQVPGEVEQKPEEKERQQDEEESSENSLEEIIEETSEEDENSPAQKPIQPKITPETNTLIQKTNQQSEDKTDSKSHQENTIEDDESPELPKLPQQHQTLLEQNSSSDNDPNLGPLDVVTEMTEESDVSAFIIQKEPGQPFGQKFHEDSSSDDNKQHISNRNDPKSDLDSPDIEYSSPPTFRNDRNNLDKDLKDSYQIHDKNRLIIEDKPTNNYKKPRVNIPTQRGKLSKVTEKPQDEINEEGSVSNRDISITDRGNKYSERSTGGPGINIPKLPGLNTRQNSKRSRGAPTSGRQPLSMRECLTKRLGSGYFDTDRMTDGKYTYGMQEEIRKVRENKLKEINEKDLGIMHISDRIQKIMESYESASLLRAYEINGQSKLSHTDKLTKVLITILLVILIFRKPEWCRDLGPKIDQNCELVHDKKTFYLRSFQFVFELPQENFLILFGMLLLTFLKISKLAYCTYSEGYRKHLLLLTFLVQLFVIQIQNEEFANIWSISYSNLLTFIFLVIYIDVLRRPLIRFINIWLSTLFIFQPFLAYGIVQSMIARVCFYDYQNFYNSKNISDKSFDFRTVVHSIYSMFNLQTFSNFPYLMIGGGIETSFALVFFILFVVSMNFVFIAFLTAILYYYYQSHYHKSVRKLKGHTNLALKILDEYKQNNSKDINDQNLKEFVMNYCKDNNTDFINNKGEILLNFDKKIKRIYLKKLEEKRTGHNQNEVEKLNKKNHKDHQRAAIHFLDRHNFNILKFRRTWTYQFIILFVNILIALLTLQVISGMSSQKEQRSVTALFFQNQLLVLTIFDNIFVLLEKGIKNFFKNFGDSLELISTLLLYIISAVLLSINKTIVLWELLDHHPLFLKLYCQITMTKLYKIFSYLKLNRLVEKICEVLTNVTRFLPDLMVVLSIVIIFFSGIGMLIFGGQVNSAHLKYYQLVFDKPQNISNCYYNFNDWFGGVITLIVVLVVGWNDITDYLIFKMETKSYKDLYFFVTFYILARLLILNIMIAYIIHHVIVIMRKQLKFTNLSEYGSSDLSETHQDFELHTKREMVGEYDEKNGSNSDSDLSMKSKDNIKEFFKYPKEYLTIFGVKKLFGKFKNVFESKNQGNDAEFFDIDIDDPHNVDVEITSPTKINPYPTNLNYGTSLSSKHYDSNKFSSVKKSNGRDNIQGLYEGRPSNRQFQSGGNLRGKGSKHMIEGKYFLSKTKQTVN